MKKGSIVQQVRAVREQIEDQYLDAESFYQHLEQEQGAYKSRLVRRTPKRSSRAQAG